MLGYDYVVLYKKGKDNLVVDALSRCNDSRGQGNVVHSCIPLWKQEVQQSLEGDMVSKELMLSVAIDSGTNPGHHVVDGELRKDGKLYIGEGNQLRKRIIDNIHNNSEGGHSGITATTKRIEVMFFWPTIRREVMEYIKACDTCQRCKPQHIATPGLLQPIPIQDKSWETISMNIIECHPKSNGKEVILVVVDKLTRYGHFIALNHPYTTE